MLRSWILSVACLSVATLATNAQSAESAESSRPLSPELLGRFDLEAGALARLVVPTQASAFQVAVPLGERDVTLTMWPHDVRSLGYRLLVEDETGLHHVPTPASVTLRGRILGAPDSRVAGMLVDGKFSATIHEDLNAPELGVWAVQPVDEFGPTSPWHVVYHSADVRDLPGVCGVADAPMQLRERRQTVGAQTLKVCEIAFDADNQYYNLLGQSVLAVENDIVNVLNNVDVIYVRDVAITYELTTVIVRTAEPDPYTSSTPGTLLEQFRSHWNGSQQGVQRDIAHLFTGRDLSGNVIGVAWLGVICTSQRPYGLSQSRYTGNLFFRTGLTAHELGHNWNAPHCNTSGGCQLMCSSNGGCGGPGGFGPDSTATILAHKATRPCLSDPFPPSLSSLAPSSVQAYLGDTLSISGSNLSGLDRVEVGSNSYDPAFSNLTIVDDSTIELSLIVAPALGANAVTAFNLAGPSNALNVDVTVTEPPRLAAPGVGVLGSNLLYTTGSEPGEVWYLFASLDDPTTLPFQGYDVLVSSSWLGLSGTLDAVGFGATSITVTDPSLLNRTVYLHSILLGPGFAGVTNVDSTTFIL
ncbi:MAG: M12 family metallo-peptidase [Planctomycetota bacterium]